ncbi:polar amino acid transport system permease protein [Anoxybacillus calidus]|jgi:polar amino acid transport system permease protein|uniref:Polar amino acid transport system permease protein n=1 Tax=[Anoxybacillus] calidus TaxID=575178 RepID=A0A7V9YZ38_9BACL|nr:amino acid ABC transporter permease [Anoxybacillus calidus]MBA2871102.1 polar amino acid transport system permease protein [Anoxybacillus calidus]
MNLLEKLDFPTAFRELSPILIQGLGIVLGATLCGFFLALLLGTLIALGRISKVVLLDRMLIILLEIVRGTPLLVQLVYMYYVVPLLITIVGQLWDPSFRFTLSPFTAGVIGLGINYGCYLSEVIRSAITSVDKGQFEAALALGYTNRQAMWLIVIPQAVRIALPTFGNYIIMMIKDTSLLAFITVSELLLRTQAYASQTFLTIESYTLLALAYLVLSLPLAQIVRIMERRLTRHV